jgi:hypothetical protein
MQKPRRDNELSFGGAMRFSLSRANIDGANDQPGRLRGRVGPKKKAVYHDCTTGCVRAQLVVYSLTAPVSDDT